VPWEKSIDNLIVGEDVHPWDIDRAEAKEGRTFSTRNVNRIRGALEAARSALADLDDMLEMAMPRTEAGPPDQAPTDSVTAADIDQYIKEILRELSEE